MLIGDAARSSGVSARMLRHYEALGLVRPTGRTSAGYRDYSAEDVRRIFQVESLRSMGLSLKQVGRALEDPDLTPAALVVDLIRCTEERLAQERELLDRLRAIDASVPADWRDVLRVIDLMRDLDSESAARRQQAVPIRSAGAPVPVELLAEALLSESEPDVAGALRWAIARSGGDAVAALRAGARAEDTDVRRRAVPAISEVPEAPGAAVVLTQALDDPDTVVRDAPLWRWGDAVWPRPSPSLSRWWSKAPTMWRPRRCWECCAATTSVRPGSSTLSPTSSPHPPPRPPCDCD